MSLHSCKFGVGVGSLCDIPTSRSCLSIQRSTALPDGGFRTGCFTGFIGSKPIDSSSSCSLQLLSRVLRAPWSNPSVWTDASFIVFIKSVLVDMPIDSLSPSACSSRSLLLRRSFFLWWSRFFTPFHQISSDQSAWSRSLLKPSACSRSLLHTSSDPHHFFVGTVLGKIHRMDHRCQIHCRSAVENVLAAVLITQLSSLGTFH